MGTNKEDERRRRMNKLELLKEYYDMEANNVFAYSANYLMTIPRKGYEKEWQLANDKLTILTEIIKEYEAREKAL